MWSGDRRGCEQQAVDYSETVYMAGRSSSEGIVVRTSDGPGDLGWLRVSGPSEEAFCIRNHVGERILPQCSAGAAADLSAWEKCASGAFDVMSLISTYIISLHTVKQGV